MTSFETLQQHGASNMEVGPCRNCKLWTRCWNVISRKPTRTISYSFTEPPCWSSVSKQPLKAIHGRSRRFDGVKGLKPKNFEIHETILHAAICCDCGKAHLKTYANSGIVLVILDSWINVVKHVESVKAKFYLASLLNHSCFVHAWVTAKWFSKPNGFQGLETALCSWFCSETSI